MPSPSTTEKTPAQSDGTWRKHSVGPNDPLRLPFRLRPFCAASSAALALVAWGEHIHTSWSEGAWGFLIAGALIVPLGIVHGIGVWVGLW